MSTTTVPTLVCLSFVALLQIAVAQRFSRSWMDLTPIPHFPSPPHSAHVFRSLLNERNEKLAREGTLERTLVGAYFNMLGKYGKKPANLVHGVEHPEKDTDNGSRSSFPSRIIIRDVASNKIRTEQELPYGSSKSAKALCGMMKLC